MSCVYNGARAYTVNTPLLVKILTKFVEVSGYTFSHFVFEREKARVSFPGPLLLYSTSSFKFSNLVQKKYSAAANHV